MTEQDARSVDLTDYEWELDRENSRNVYAKWTEGRAWHRSLVAQFTDAYLANQAVVAQHFRLEQARSAKRPKPLADQIAEVLNRNSMENASNTPDFLLAEYLERCLAAAGTLISRRDHWYGVELRPGYAASDEVADASILCGSCSYDGITGNERFCPQCGVEFDQPPPPASP